MIRNRRYGPGVHPHARLELKQRLWRSAVIWGTIALGVVGSVVGIVTFSHRSSAKEQMSLALSKALPSDWRRGAGNAKVLLIEYGDYQCAPCAAYNLMIERVIAEYGSRITFVYRHFPLRRIHRYADLAARAAEAAGRQGRYWEMHTLLYQRQREWANAQTALAVFESYARLLGLDQARFAADLKDTVLVSKVESDYQTGLHAEVDGTPTFYVQGKKTTIAPSYPQLRRLLEEALRHAGDAMADSKAP